MIITAEKFLNDTHGKDCEFLTRQAIVDLMERYAQRFYAAKLQQTIIPNDTYVESRKNYPKQPPIGDLP